MFQTYNFSSTINLLDDVTFSTQPLPEPGVLTLLAAGVALFSLRYSARRARLTVHRRNCVPPAPDPGKSSERGKRSSRNGAE